MSNYSHIFIKKSQIQLKIKLFRSWNQKCTAKISWKGEPIYHNSRYWPNCGERKMEVMGLPWEGDDRRKAAKTVTSRPWGLPFLGRELKREKTLSEIISPHVFLPPPSIKFFPISTSPPPPRAPTVSVLPGIFFFWQNWFFFFCENLLAKLRESNSFPHCICRILFLQFIYYFLLHFLLIY